MIILGFEIKWVGTTRMQVRKEWMETGSKIWAIKLHRKLTGLGLKESKAYCDAMQNSVMRDLIKHDSELVQKASKILTAERHAHERDDFNKLIEGALARRCGLDTRARAEFIHRIKCKAIEQHNNEMREAGRIV